MNEQERLERLAEADARRAQRQQLYEDWENRVKAAAREIFAILLTPAGCAYLYDMRVETVGQTKRRHELEAVRVVAGFGGQGVALLRYEWAQDHWAERRIEDRFEDMMKFGHVMEIGGTMYVILHPNPIIEDRYSPNVHAPGMKYAADIGKGDQA